MHNASVDPLAASPVALLAVLLSWTVNAQPVDPEALTQSQRPLVGVDLRELPPLPVTFGARLVVVDGRLLALGREASWLLGANAREWMRVDWLPPGEVTAVASDETSSFLLLRAPDGTVQRVERLVLRNDQPELRSLPMLPVPLRTAHGAVRAGTLYIAGINPNGARSLYSISVTAPGTTWTTLASSSADTDPITSLVAQNSALYLTLRSPSGSERLIRWRADEGWLPLGTLAGTVVEGTARALGQAHAMYLLGAPDGAGPSSLATFHTITRSWTTLAQVPQAPITGGTAWRDGVVWLQQGAADSPLRSAQLQASNLLIQTPDWIVIVLYLLGMTGIGLYFYLKEKRLSTADFFVGSRSIPFWAAGMSLYATNTSSISYIAIPAKAYETNWQYLTNNLVAVTGLIFVAIWVVPLLRRLDLMSVFHYLEIRFHPVIRMLASALCVLVQIGSRLSVILFLPALAISTMTGLDVVWAIWIMGAITIAYTTLGGMKAVIWTDFVQLFVMFGGALFAIGFIILSLDGGVGEFIAATVPENKTKLLDFSFDLTEATVWGFVFLVLFDVVLTFPKDQVLMQRVLSTRSAKDAGKSVWTMAAIMIPGGFLFYFIGTALYVFYQSHPERLNPLMSIDATFPLFIAAELPVGVTGLIIAGILAASMSTLSSILNSVATLISVDFYEKLVKKPDAAVSVRFAEAMTVMIGLIGIGCAWLLSRYDIHSLFDTSIELAGLLGGGFAGAYTLGMLTRRANWQGVSIGVAAAIILTTAAWSVDLVHPYFYLAISIMVCIVVGYLASYLFPPPQQSLVGLTIYREDAVPALAVD